MDILDAIQVRSIVPITSLDSDLVQQRDAQSGDYLLVNIVTLNKYVSYVIKSDLCLDTIVKRLAKVISLYVIGLDTILLNKHIDDRILVKLRPHYDMLYAFNLYIDNYNYAFVNDYLNMLMQID